jgi:hypothetical protein
LCAGTGYEILWKIDVITQGRGGRCLAMRMN